MQKHIYLRAYMAGIVVPTILLLVAATVFTIFRYIYNVPVPIERVIVFPMAVVPNAWGLWSLEVSGRFSEPSCRTRLSLSEAGLSARTGFEMRKPAPFHDCFDLPCASTVYPRCSRPPGAASNFWTNFMEELCGRSSKRKPNHRP